MSNISIMSREPTHSFIDYPTPIDDCVTIFMVGCDHKCEDCHNSGLAYYESILNDYDNSKYFKIVSGAVFYSVINDLCNKFKTRKVVIQGGDPFFDKNRGNILELLHLNAAMGSTFDICIYTGYSLDECKSFGLKNGFKYLKTGTFKKDLYQTPGKTNEAFTLASKNQEFYDENFNLLTIEGVYTFELN